MKSSFLLEMMCTKEYEDEVKNIINEERKAEANARKVETADSYHSFYRNLFHPIHPILHNLTRNKLLDRKGLLYVAEALVYVESPTKVDNFFGTFCLL
jgi:hypothetical protein